MKNLLDDPPSAKKYLHKRLIVGKRTDYQVLPLVSPNSVGSTLICRHYANTKPIRRLKLTLIDLDRGPYVPITISCSQEQISLPQPIDARR